LSGSLSASSAAASSGEDERGSTAHLTDDKPEEVVVFCSECDEREFGEPAE
jgi:hypothetical protein